MLFMPSGGVVIEVRPDNWPMPCFIDLADNAGLQVTFRNAPIVLLMYITVCLLYINYLCISMFLPWPFAYQ